MHFAPLRNTWCLHGKVCPTLNLSNAFGLRTPTHHFLCLKCIKKAFLQLYFSFKTLDQNPQLGDTDEPGAKRLQGNRWFFLGIQTFWDSVSGLKRWVRKGALNTGLHTNTTSTHYILHQTAPLKVCWKVWRNTLPCEWCDVSLLQTLWYDN